MHMTLGKFDTAMENLVVLIADRNSFTRRLTRAMLARAKSVYEVGDGAAALQAIRNLNPDVMIMDWHLPVLDGREVMRIVRAPEVFPKPNLPIIMLMDVGEHAHVHEAMQLGVHEVLLKPISPKTLQERLFGMIVKPRPMVWIGKSYVPQPRRQGDVSEPITAPEGADEQLAESA
jgi:two-component system, chemotaxis family, chemotaxis protein CheY